MNRKRMNALAALQLVALQLFAALAFAAPNVGSHTTSASPVSGSAYSSHGTSEPSGVQRRRRRARRRREADALLPGVWGGEHIRFEVTATGANIEYDCAHGTVEGKILVDASGRFNVAGTHYREHGGPVREGEGSAANPYAYGPRRRQPDESLTVTRGRETIGTYYLTRDNEGRVFKCR